VRFTAVSTRQKPKPTYNLCKKAKRFVFFLKKRGDPPKTKPFPYG
jgi:hypothetical protein